MPYTGSLSSQFTDRGLLCFTFNRPPKRHYSIKRDDLYIVGIQKKRVIPHYSTAYFRCYLAVTVVALDLIFWGQRSVTFISHIPFGILDIRSIGWGAFRGGGFLLAPQTTPLLVITTIASSSINRVFILAPLLNIFFGVHAPIFLIIVVVVWNVFSSSQRWTVLSNDSVQIGARQSDVVR